MKQTAIITGASEGIGAELARVFAEKGHALALVARRKDRLDALADEIAESARPRPLVIELDLLAPKAVETLAKTLADNDRVVNYLVNNAGFGLLGAVADLDPAEQLTMVDLNIRALTELTLRFLPQIIEQRGGVLNVASIAAFMPGPGFAVYYASKAYVRSFSEALAEEVSALGVKVTALCPGPVATGFQSRASFDFSGARAGMKPAMLPAATVAREGYEALMAERRVVVPGVVNKLLIWVARLTPRPILSPLLFTIQRRHD